MQALAPVPGNDLDLAGGGLRTCRAAKPNGGAGQAGRHGGAGESGREGGDGNPKVIVENRPGAGGVLAANKELLNTSPAVLAKLKEVLK